ncbi:hypothetical protein D1610_00150 [Sphingomonas gilva]|uniref:Uncharacterized protein n=1 Tax=Sphingomonas gilva TaxID=2305907 RepID=A0A396S5D7_9SPHN|nr:hypothetical protein [Sphingomonas gilva]RHW18625.1 hypothetical protein D1610_00150 [Sphingomonas gilva]
MAAAAISRPPAPGQACAPHPRDDVRHGVRALLSDQQGFSALDDRTRRDIASSLVRIGSVALDNHEAAAPPATKPVARALNAGREFSGAATDRLASTTHAVLNAVSFPRFVTELITGVFKAMNDSNQQQLTAFVDLIRNVAQTTEGFADSNVGVAGAREWIAERFPGSYMIEGAEEDPFPEDLSGLSPEERREREAEIQAERDAAIRLVLRPGAAPPTDAALRAAFGTAEGETISGGNPEALVPFARQVLARNRQQLLATMVQMGLQRIVIESGRLNASMRFHIDTSSAAANDRGSQFDMRNTVEAGVGAKFGPWGAEAKVQNTIGYVSTDRTQTSEEINTELDLDSAVELVFRTDYVPLDRLATGEARERIMVNTINPEDEAQRIATERSARATARATERAARTERTEAITRTPPAPDPPAAIDTSRLATGDSSTARAAPVTGGDAARAEPVTPPVAPVTPPVTPPVEPVTPPVAPNPAPVPPTGSTDTARAPVVPPGR